jgi:hypothetical protein
MLSGNAFTIKDIWWTDAIDNDGDGYTSYRKLNIDVDVVSGVDTIYVKLFEKKSESYYWNHYYTTDDFIISNNSTIDVYQIVVQNIGYSSFTYDFMVEIYKSNDEIIKMFWEPEDDIDLNNENFE